MHTGARVRLQIAPAPVDHGVVFRRTDLADSALVSATAKYVVNTDRGTTLGRGDVRVHTVEHLLAALAASGIDNADVSLDGPEVPIGDGSALPFIALLAQAGTEEQSERARVIRIDAPVQVQEGSASYVIAPADEMRVSATIEWEHPLIGRQFGSFPITSDVFARELAPARTFCLEAEVAGLRARGLALGGSEENAVVLSDTGIRSGGELRFPDEFVRHKVLDLVGDLALMGARLQGHVTAVRPGHRGNVALARAILAQAKQSSASQPVLNIEQILQYLPHRYPFLLVDRIIEFEERKRIVGLKNVTINEPFFVGHFPGRPVMPGVLIVEAMAQVGGLLMMEQMDSVEDKIVYFMSVDKVKWRRPVVPGDQIRFELEVLQIRGTTCRMRGVGLVDGSVVAEAEMMARVVDR